MRKIITGVTPIQNYRIIRLQWILPEFSVIEPSQEGMYILLDGIFNVQDRINTYEMQPGELLFVKRGKYAVSTKNKTSQLIWLPIDNIQLQLFMQRFGPHLSEIFEPDDSTPNLLLFNTSRLLKRCIEGIQNLSDHEYPQAIAQLRLEELLILLAFSHKGPQLMTILRQISNRQTERLQLFMENNYLKDWKLSEFSREFGMSLTTFKELFYTIYNIPPRAWISERRILYSHQLLLNSDKSIVDIAMESGYSSQSYFTQSYRRRFGCTPSKARQGKARQGKARQGKDTSTTRRAK